MSVKELHVGAMSCVNVKDGGAKCMNIGEDGRVNLVRVTGSRLSCCQVFDSDGLVSYTEAKFVSPVEFAIGGYRFSLQWWVLTVASGWWIWWLKVVLGSVSLKFGFFCCNLFNLWFFFFLTAIWVDLILPYW